ncbi:GD25896 [Drosophila simulans]|uniref:GD25896 n=1 Tax=Drosophila simulans TaxID=7240 RepID=B4QBM4_DROSI|nr:GD25896 [Drosophila simulans]
MATSTSSTITIGTTVTPNNMAVTATHPIEMVTLVAATQEDEEAAVETTTALTEAAQFWSRD